MKVLVAVDGSEPAIRAVRTVASMLAPDRDHVRLLTVMSYSDYPYTGIPGVHLVDEGQREQHEREEVRRITDEARNILEQKGLDVEVAHRFGNPTQQIVTEIAEWEADLTVLGRRGVHGLERLIGSVSEHVLHHANVPILIVP